MQTTIDRRTRERRVRTRLTVCACAGLVLMVSSLLATNAAADDDLQWQRAVGTWLFTIDLGGADADSKRLR